MKYSFSVTTERIKRTYAASDSSGRSMVEMLGVLAIIAVLSASALTGYSKAMFKHKMTQTIDTVSLILQRFQELSSKKLGNDFKIQTTEDIIKYGLMPDCKVLNDSECQLPIGTIQMYLPGYIDITFHSVKECIAFASANWEKSLPTEFFNNGANLDIGGTGDIIIYDSETNLTSLKDITQACKAMCDGSCYFEFNFNNQFFNRT